MSKKSTAPNRILQLIQSQDIYGHAIGVHYKDEDHFKTYLGSLCSLAVYVLMFVNLTTLLISF